VKRRIKHLIDKRRNRDALKEDAPRITNDTVAAHREEVLSSARKYVTPLEHSKHRIVVISSSLFLVAIVFFLTYCTLALYKFQSDSTFLYRVTQVVPFPIARTGSKLVAYENYLFELRRYKHYYETQVKLDFNDPKNKDQLTDFKKRAVQKVVSEVYIKQLAQKNNVYVTDREVNDQITLLRAQNRLGGNEKVFEDVLKDYWGWSVDDFKRSLRQELLAQKLLATLDSDTSARAKAAQAELQGGADFAAIAKKYSDDIGTKENGGEFGVAISKTDPNVTAQSADALFKLKPGQVSDIINIGSGLEIIKNIETNGDRVRAAHIIFTFKDLNSYLNDIKEKQPSKVYIKI
jgi:hypothetical protein